MFRGSGKSKSITIPVPLFLALLYPNISTAIGSETLPKAKTFLQSMKAILDGSDHNARFTWLFGNWYDPDRSWKEESVVHAYRTSLSLNEPSIGTFGVETGLTSQHPLGCFYDDPLSHEKLEAGEGSSWNDKALRSLNSLAYALVPDIFYMLVATRYLVNDPIGYSLRTEGVASWHGHAPLEDFPENPNGFHVYFLQARDRHNITNYPRGEPVLPEAGFTDEWLANDERIRPAEHASQMMGDASRGEHMEMTIEQCEELLIDRTSIPKPEYATIHLDTAFKDDARRGKGDDNVIAVWLHDMRPTGLVILDQIQFSNQWRSEEFDTELIKVMYSLFRRNIRVRCITDEVEVGGKRGVYKNHLLNVIAGAGLRPCEIIQFQRQGTRKVLRIREAATNWLSGHVRVCRDANGYAELFRQMTHIGDRSMHDDLADACADVWRPEIWRGPPRVTGDDMPPPIFQPGDDVLKQATILRDQDALLRDLRSGAEANEFQTILYPNDATRW